MDINCKFQASLDYRVRLCLESKQTKDSGTTDSQTQQLGSKNEDVLAWWPSQSLILTWMSRWKVGRSGYLMAQNAQMQTPASITSDGQS